MFLEGRRLLACVKRRESAWLLDATVNKLFYMMLGMTCGCGALFGLFWSQICLLVATVLFSHSYRCVWSGEEEEGDEACFSGILVWRASFKMFRYERAMRRWKTV
jgi:hypothetical protein